MAMLRNALLLSGLLGIVLGVAGCGNPNERGFTTEPGSAPPDAPQTPEEYDALHPTDPDSV